MSSAVVLVSGGAAVTPFTTPDAAAAQGLAAGNTMTALRQHFLDRGALVFTAPARIGAGEISEDTGWQGFSDVPTVLPADVTVNAVGDIDVAGASLSAFLTYLHDEYHVDELDIVAHSMGGLFSRSAIRQGREQGALWTVKRLVTLGTPWSGSFLGDYRVGDLALADAHGDAITEKILQEFDAYATENSQGAAEELPQRKFDGPDGWNARQGNALAEVKATLVAGSYFHASTSPESLWPHDGLVAAYSALAKGVSDDVLPHRAEHTFDNVHSIFVADAVGLPWEHALTWNPAVFDVIDDALA